jgi:phage baseplate assembly protein W
MVELESIHLSQLYLQDMVVVAEVEQVPHKIQQEQVLKVVEMEARIQIQEVEEQLTLEVVEVVQVYLQILQEQMVVVE